ncbi:hypothetical protein [Ralstonia phage RSF1]|uniref:Uncharacterized protein n=1 Tax=Ralstonia phage RSF1 TaxID=1689679 RepID=A0A0K2QQP4_9CAUD|nr:HNH endonuclease [Ralstonia phage RSF1]BAS04868.1 hypothetical protein [Ralstonia phage RSF1]
MIEYKGETRSMSEWARLYGISKSMLSKRLSAGLPFELALLKPSIRQPRLNKITD